ncbi:hypothetical protein WK92_26650 [Burkholderia ubonensis]|nr:hypothetical protein WK82_17545 [Burkholderia ubonensis]KVW30977.1 hypothetical protein WK92_26650 [Burkholderia ubonensis]
MSCVRSREEFISEEVVADGASDLCHEPSFGVEADAHVDVARAVTERLDFRDVRWSPLVWCMKEWAIRPIIGYMEV